MNQIDQRITVIEHDVGDPPWPQHAMHLGHGALDVRCVMEDAEGVHDVEAAIRELEPLGVAEPEVDAGLAIRGKLPGDLQGVLGQIDAGDFETTAFELDAVDTDPTSNFQK